MVLGLWLGNFDVWSLPYNRLLSYGGGQRSGNLLVDFAFDQAFGLWQRCDGFVDLPRNRLSGLWQQVMVIWFVDYASK